MEHHPHRRDVKVQAPSRARINPLDPRSTVTIDLGYRPQGLTVVVTPASTFAAALRSSAGPWADGTVITLVFHNAAGTVVATWPATITTDTAAWTKNPAAVDTLIAATPTRAVLWYTDGTSPVEWARGKVTVAR